jgi:uncharacterized protein (TIGR00251 family)
MSASKSGSPTHFLMSVKVIPSASRSCFVGYRGGMAVFKIKAPPEAGKANHELIAFLAKTLGVKKSEISCVSGLTSRQKTLALPITIRASLTSFFPLVPNTSS